MTTRGGPPPPSLRRQVAAMLAGAFTGAVGAIVLGEYDLSGITPFVGGVLFGLFIAEVVLTVARVGTPVLAVAAAVITAGGVYWAAWISFGRVSGLITGRAYAGLVLGALTSGGWVLLPTRQRKARRGETAGAEDTTSTF